MSGTGGAPRDVIAGWTSAQIDQLELSFLHEALECESSTGVDVAITLAAFMARHALDADNYPVFLRLLQLPNHWVADALLGGASPETFFSPVQPNQFMVRSCFEMLAAHRPGEIYDLTLRVIIGFLRRVYEQPKDGHRVYPLNVTDVNNLAKHLDESEGQSNVLNQAILHILDRLASLADPGLAPPSDKQIADVATQANNIRGKFLDATKHVREAIPTELLRRGDYRKDEVAPSTRGANGNSAQRASKLPPDVQPKPTAGRRKPAATAARSGAKQE